jgi:hypothetical protein
MNAKKIDIFNIFLVIISLIIAVITPFKLFLFSYAILGPLHYLTEITWLHKKNYFFSANKKWSIIFIILTLLVSLNTIFKFIDWEINQSIAAYIKLIGKQTNILLLIGFLFAVSLIFFKKRKDLILAFILTLPVSFIIANYIPNLLLFIGVFLPTLIHVYIFTLFFILYGTIKSKSKYGIYLSILLLAVPFIIFFIPIDSINYQPSAKTKDTFSSTNIKTVGKVIAQLLNKLQDGNFSLLSETGLRIQIFISFAYTYHYLNWFSKTSIIGWKNAISKRKYFLILFIWILSMGLYIYDFRTGLITLFFLSFLHVLLELPLNITTIKEVFLMMKKKYYMRLRNSRN